MDDAPHNCKNISGITSSDEEVRLLYKEGIDVLNNKWPTAHNFPETLTDLHSNVRDEVLMTSAAGPSGSSSILEDLFQTSESLSNSPRNDNHAQKQFHEVNDNRDDWMPDIRTPALYQADHNLPYVHMGRQQVPPNYVHSYPAEADQDCRKMTRYDADDQKGEFAVDKVLISSAAGPSGSSSILEDLFQTSESLSNSPRYDNHTQKQFQGVNDNPDDWIRDIPTPALYQADHNLPDVQMDRQVLPINCVLNDPAEVNFLHPSACEPLDNRERSFPFPEGVNGNEEYSRFQEMGRHIIQVHTVGKKRFICSECGLETPYVRNLRKHLRTQHTDREDPYKCNMCTYETSWKHNLKKHMQTHIEKKSFKCEVCTYETSRRGNMKRHMESHPRPFKCGVCNYETYRLGDLTEHMKQTHTGEDKRFKCDMCSFVSPWFANLKRHVEDIHKNP